LVVLLLKVVMISPKSRMYLESRIGELIAHHKSLPEADCEWLIQFLEVLRVTFTIYSDNTVNYDLVTMPIDPCSTQAATDLKTYRIFSSCSAEEARQEEEDSSESKVA
ncbi:MAG: hypothetical protein AB4042_16035, partial [Leptolyngbyaceae cyanobacterium]